MKRPGTNIKSTAEGPKPLFFPSRTTHTRLFPKTHSFSYSYLLVGIPVGWQGSVGGMLSADQGTHSRQKWFKMVLQAVAGILLMLEIIWTEDTVILGWMGSLENSYRVRYALPFSSRFRS